MPAERQWCCCCIINVCAQAAKPHQQLSLSAVTPCFRGLNSDSLSLFVGKMMAPVLQNSCTVLQQVKQRQSAQSPSALPSGPAVPKERPAWGGPAERTWNRGFPKVQEASGLHSEKLQRPGCWVVGGVGGTCPRNQSCISVSELHASHSCSLTFWCLSPPKYAHSLRRAPLGC